jgi:hypothetical protein
MADAGDHLSQQSEQFTELCSQNPEVLSNPDLTKFNVSSDEEEDPNSPEWKSSCDMDCICNRYTRSEDPCDSDNSDTNYDRLYDATFSTQPMTSEDWQYEDIVSNNSII